uniref:Uncharacterized protein n=1 Tax=Arundo donax TaxID=35708 RepID=A0A0A9B4J6_ARUDO
MFKVHYCISWSDHWIEIIINPVSSIYFTSHDKIIYLAGKKSKL